MCVCGQLSGMAAMALPIGSSWGYMGWMMPDEYEYHEHKEYHEHNEYHEHHKYHEH